MGEVVEAFLGGFVCGFEVLGDLVEGLADSRVVATDHCCGCGAGGLGEAVVVCAGAFRMGD